MEEGANSVALHILDLARKHNVSYVEIPSDRLANTLTRLSDDEVHLDSIELLLIALQRANILDGATSLSLHAEYLREKHGHL